jgi:hypothetical protein
MFSLRTRHIARLLSLVLVFAAAPLAHAADDTCNLLTNAEIAQATNDPVLHAAGMPKDCIWSGDKARVYITTRDASTWASGKAQFQQYGGSNMQPVSGVGDDAFFMGPGPTPTFYALKGAHFIILRVNVKGFTQAQNEAAMKALATSALGRL